MTSCNTRKRTCSYCCKRANLTASEAIIQKKVEHLSGLANMRIYFVTVKQVCDMSILSLTVFVEVGENFERKKIGVI